MIYVNDFQGSDNEKIEQAIAAKGLDGVVVLEPKKDGTPWLLDRAILLPENTTFIVRNCKIKLSDNCRDNFFRTANCGMGIDEPKPIENVRIIGEGRAILEGADHPRASGDSSKILKNPCPFEREDILKYADWVTEEKRASGNLDFWDYHLHSYGTDSGKEGESQYGDWRGIGVLFANVDDFEIKNLRIVESHGWGISIESGRHGRIEKIDFDARMSKKIDGMLSNMENQDGIDIRNGCNHIIISDITGNTGDDVIALTAIARDNGEKGKGGALCSTHVMNHDWEKRDRNIHDITIKNVQATSYLCWVVRLLAANTKIYNVIIENIIDTGAAINPVHGGTFLLGEGGYDASLDFEKECMENVVINNVVSTGAGNGICVAGCMQNSVISNVVHKNPNTPAFVVNDEKLMRNVIIFNVK